MAGPNTDSPTPSTHTSRKRADSAYQSMDPLPTASSPSSSPEPTTADSPPPLPPVSEVEPTRRNSSDSDSSPVPNPGLSSGERAQMGLYDIDGKTLLPDIFTPEECLKYTATFFISPCGHGFSGESKQKPTANKQYFSRQNFEAYYHRVSSRGLKVEVRMGEQWLNIVRAYLPVGASDELQHRTATENAKSLSKLLSNLKKEPYSWDKFLEVQGIETNSELMQEIVPSNMLTQVVDLLKKSGLTEQWAYYLLVLFNPNDMITTLNQTWCDPWNDTKDTKQQVMDVVATFKTWQILYAVFLICSAMEYERLDCIAYQNEFSPSLKLDPLGPYENCLEASKSKEYQQAYDGYCEDTQGKGAGEILTKAIGKTKTASQGGPEYESNVTRVSSSPEAKKVYISQFELCIRFYLIRQIVMSRTLLKLMPSIDKQNPSLGQKVPYYFYPYKRENEWESTAVYQDDRDYLEPHAKFGVVKPMPQEAINKKGRKTSPSPPKGDNHKKGDLSLPTDIDINPTVVVPFTSALPNAAQILPSLLNPSNGEAPMPNPSISSHSTSSVLESIQTQTTFLPPDPNLALQLKMWAAQEKMKAAEQFYQVAIEYQIFCNLNNPSNPTAVIAQGSESPRFQLPLHPQNRLFATFVPGALQTS